MQPESPAPTNNDAPHGHPVQAAPGLPTVKPPSARFIMQLFLIPGVIVFGLVTVYLFGILQWTSSTSPKAYLDQLDNPNPDIRWRAAHELAQVLKRPESLELASDPDFALEIAVRLEKANKELNEAEAAAARELKPILDALIADTKLSDKERDERADKASKAAWVKLRPKRDLVLFLTSCLGSFNVPVGAPVLCELAAMNQGSEIKSQSLRKRQALWALIALGDNYQRRWHGKDIGGTGDTKTLTDEQKQAALDKLAKAGAGKDERAVMARYAYGVLEGKIPSGVDKYLAICARHEDIFLRELVAMALNFWDGDEVEPTLLLLAHDRGQGRRIEVPEGD
jgi:hypothetical protein